MNVSIEKRRPGRQPGTKIVDLQKTLTDVFDTVLQLKSEGLNVSSITANLVASKLYIGSKETGGNTMMTRLKDGGLKMSWPVLRDYIYGGGEITNIFDNAERSGSSLNLSI